MKWFLNEQWSDFPDEDMYRWIWQPNVPIVDTTLRQLHANGVPLQSFVLAERLGLLYHNYARHYFKYLSHG